MAALHLQLIWTAAVYLTLDTSFIAHIMFICFMLPYNSHKLQQPILTLRAQRHLSASGVVDFYFVAGQAVQKWPTREEIMFEVTVN